MTMIACIATLGLAAAPLITDYLQPGFHDATFVARVIKADQRELKKINDDFGQSYRFKTTTIHVKEPFKLRLEARVEDTSLLYIINGTHQLVRVPRLRVDSHQNLARSPGRRQTLLDFGILTASLFEDLFQSRFVRSDRATGDAVFDLTYPASLNDTSRQRIFINPQRHIVDRREWFNQYGRQLATFYYERPVEVEGIWMPTEVTVRNVDDRVAGITRYDSIKVNTGLSDSLFSTR